LGLPNAKRMKGQELLIRFFALNEDWRSYQRPLFAFLNRYCEQNRVLQPSARDRLKAHFSVGLKNCVTIFGHRPFQLTNIRGEVQSAFNAALFDAEMVASASLGKTIVMNGETRGEFDRLFSSLKADENFARAISARTSDEQSVKLRISKLSELVSNFFHGQLH
jgi:hypothetical protein